jgi:TM2 domain-containing membrane protein YozV
VAGRARRSGRTPRGARLTTYSVGVAYLLWLCLGPIGAHRFYLGKVGSGLLYLCTGGLLGIGWLIDGFRIPSLVRDANLRAGYQAALTNGQARRQAEPVRARETIERTSLRTARRNGGTITPGEIAIEGDWTIEEAQRALEKLAAAGHAEMRIRESGVIDYHFAEFERER